MAELFGKRQLKPVLVDFTTEDSEALQRYFVQAVDTATWGVLEEGYKEGYGANAAGLKTEEEIVNGNTIRPLGLRRLTPLGSLWILL